MFNVMRQRCSMKGMLVAVMLISTTAARGDTRTVPERSDIETKYLWKTEAIFPNTAAWEQEMKAVEQLIAQSKQYAGKLGDDPGKLLQTLKHHDETASRLERVMVYASLLADQDTRVSENQGMDTRAKSLATKYAEAWSWFEPAITAIPKETLDQWMVQTPELAVYGHFFDNLYRQKKHILSPREEELLAMSGDVRRVPYEAYNLLSNADLKFPTIKDENGDDVELSDSAFYLFMRNPDRRVREDAYRGIVGAFRDHRNTAAALLNGIVQSHIFEVRARNYDSCLAEALDASNIPTSVYNTLIDTVNKHADLLARYESIRNKALKLDGVRAWDLFAPLITGQSMDMDYEEAVKTVETALAPMGDEYLGVLKDGFNSRWVDVYPTKGKRSGAYSSGSYMTDPYILTNFHGGYEDMSTLAHEMGHSVHSWFSHHNQPYVYGDYDIFCAEVASTCNEIMLQHYVLEHTTDPKKKLYLIGEFLEGIRGTVFRQAMFSAFEQRIHEMAERGEPLTADSLSAAYGEIMKRFYGPDYVHDPLVDNYWIRIPHFYYNFYVYKYATSYCAASNIARRIMDGEPGAVDAYLSFLKGGSSKYPVELLKIARVDMTTPEPIEDAMKIFEGLLDQAEELLKEVNQ